MNYLLDNPVGIDIKIQRIQKGLYKHLVKKWTELDGYGRVYKNKKGKEFKPEYFISGIDYRDVFPCEKSKFFFIKGDTNLDVGTTYAQSELSLYVFVDLSEFSTVQRMDEQSLIDVWDFLKNSQFRAKHIEQGIDHFLSDFKSIIGEDITNLKTIDFQPYHVFKMTGFINYELKYKC